MLPQNATALERLLQEVQANPPIRSPGARSPRALQPLFDAAARVDLSNAVNAEFGVGANQSGNYRVVHYTSISSIVSILENAENGYLRMYSTGGSNDPGEGKYVKADDLPNGSSIQTLPNDSYAYVASFIKPNDRESSSRAANNLVFWRLYGNEGKGCSLAVNVTGQNLLAVQYGRKATRNSISRLDSAVGHLLKTAGIVAGKIGVSTQSLDQMIDVAMGKVRYLYKSEAYGYENECRIVETPQTIGEQGIAAKFEYTSQSGQELVKTYINHWDLTVEKLFSTDSFITLGPNVPHQEETKDYMKYLLKEAGRNNTDVLCSRLEYRKSSNRD